MLLAYRKQDIPSIRKSIFPPIITIIAHQALLPHSHPLPITDFFFSVLSPSTNYHYHYHYPFYSHYSSHYSSHSSSYSYSSPLSPLSHLSPSPPASHPTPHSHRSQPVTMFSFSSYSSPSPSASSQAPAAQPSKASSTTVQTTAPSRTLSNALSGLTRNQLRYQAFLIAKQHITYSKSLPLKLNGATHYTTPTQSHKSP
ncbi:hypothetical protein F5Y18DRAFT_435820 [Xylariaceae sp. FL1019]|nr:hypothetical protein F5Y18DRAFT_435820 [Xylariaceae sp. FL1019]